jgi:ketosteroid isomerase-like protein
MKRKNIYWLAKVALMTLASYSCAAQSANSELEDAKKAIAASNNIYFEAFSKHDPSIFIERYSEDCWIMPPNTPSLCGVDAPLELFKTAYDKFGLRDGKFITIDVSGNGSGFVTEVGFWQSYDANHKMFDHGKYLVLWKKTAKGWKMFRDSFSSDIDKVGKEITKN